MEMENSPYLFISLFCTFTCIIYFTFLLLCPISWLKKLVNQNYQENINSDKLYATWET